MKKYPKRQLVTLPTLRQTLPETIQNMIETQSNEPDKRSSEDNDPCTLEEATKILGMAIKLEAPVVQSVPEKISRLFALGATVYAHHELETPDGKRVPTGTAGTITQLYARNNTHGWSYDVDFTAIGTGWFFERELTSIEPIADIRITHGHIVPQEAVPPPSDTAIKQALIEHNLQPDPIEPDTTIAEASNAVADMSDEIPKVRVIKPVLDVYEGEEDAVITAICQTRAEDLPIIHSSVQSSTGKRTLTRIAQSPCGELTGSISGSVWCYGYVRHVSVFDNCLVII